MTSHKWPDYGQFLLEKGMASSFAVYSRDTGRPWTETADLHVDADQVKIIVSGFLEDMPLRTQGIHFRRQDFVLTRLTWNREMMTGRASDTGKGCVIYLCRTCVVIATYEDGPMAGLCFFAMEKIGDAFRNKGL